MYPGWTPDKNLLRRAALNAVKGVGDTTLGQWEEWSGTAYHVRRRLSPDEQSLVGDMVDVRGTEEAIRRHAAVKMYLPPSYRDRIE